MTQFVERRPLPSDGPDYHADHAAWARRFWSGLTPPYGTVVVDPPWPYPEGWPGWGLTPEDRKALPYSCMTVKEIGDLPVADLVVREGYVFLWTTNRYLPAAFDVLASWGCTYRQTIVWCKEPQGEGPGGMLAQTTEYVVIGQRIGPRSHARGKRTSGERVNTSWFVWPRGAHSEKPAAALDLIERLGRPPFVELFARQPRLGWDHWGHGYELGTES